MKMLSREEINDILEKIHKGQYDLRYASEEIRSNPEIVLEAVKKDGDALQYASEELKKNPDIVMEAVKKDGDAIQHVSQSYVKLYRRMSLEELEKYLNGENLIAYNEPNRDSSANKPSFFFADSLYDLEQFGINSDVVCEFIVDKKSLSLFKEGYASVRHILNWGMQRYTDYVKEYCIPEYNNNILKLTSCVIESLYEELYRIDDGKIMELMLGRRHLIKKYMDCPSYYKDYCFKECEKLLLGIGIDINNIEKDDFEKIAEKYPDLYEELEEKGMIEGVRNIDFLTKEERKRMKERFLFYGIDVDNMTEEELLNAFNKIQNIICCNFKEMTQEDLKLITLLTGENRIHNISILKCFNNNLLFDIESIRRKIDEELDIEANGDYDDYDNDYYDDQDYYSDDYEEDYYTADEIAEDIEPREGEIEEVIKETEESARQNDKEKSNEQDGQTQAD